MSTRNVAATSQGAAGAGHLVLLTGATGFVGRHVLRELLRSAKRVRIVIRPGKQDQFDGLEGIESVVISPDLFAEDQAWWSQVCRGVDTVVHLAWYAEPGKYLQSALNFDCLAGTLILAKAAIAAGVGRFVGAGTCFEYDLSVGMLSVDTPLRPLTPYAAAKAATFMALSQQLPLQNVQFGWCRLFYLYGEGEDSRRLVPYLSNRLSTGQPAELTSGNQIRDFLEVSAAARMLVEYALGNEQGPVNICSGVPTTIRQLAERIADQYGRRDLLKFGTRADNLIDPPCVVGIKWKGA